MPHTLTYPLRRKLLLSAALMLTGSLVHAREFTEISWDDLVPADWDPSKSFKNMEHLMELPDDDPRVLKLYDKMREVWDNAPGVLAMSGRKVKLPGYIVPLDEDKKGLREFLLVPYFGACIHTPPPPANQIVLVRSNTPIKGVRVMDAVWASGTLTLQRGDSSLGISGYRLDAKSVVKYKEK